MILQMFRLVNPRTFVAEPSFHDVFRYKCENGVQDSSNSGSKKPKNKGTSCDGSQKKLLAQKASSALDI
jgi:hypothetical protein